MSDEENKKISHASLPYSISRLGAKIELVELAREIETADRTVASVANAKLTVIADQIKALQAQAHKVLDEAKWQQALHHVQCNFQKKPGHIYFLYMKNNGLFFSMLSPEEWGGSLPYPFQGAFRLQLDLSWEQLEGDEDDWKKFLPH